MIVDSAEAAKSTAHTLLDTINSALSGVDPDFSVVLRPEDGRPVKENDDIRLLRVEFSPPILPEFELNLQVGLSVPVSLQATFPLRFKHSWNIEEDPKLISKTVETRLIDQATGLPLEPGSTSQAGVFFQGRVVKTYLHELTYQADVAVGPISLPPSATTFEWVLEHTTKTEWA